MTPLEQVLDDLSAALRHADFAALGPISARLETVSLPAEPAALRRAARAGTLNAALLGAAASGLRAARRRIEALQTGDRVSTYDRQGIKTTLPPRSDRTKRV